MLLDNKSLLVDAERNNLIFIRENMEVYGSTMEIKRV